MQYFEYTVLGSKK